MIDRLLEWIRDLLDPYPYVHRVAVHTKTGKSISGVLWGRRRGFLVLREARLLEHGKQIPLDGETLVDRENVDFMQVLAPIGGEA